MLLKEVERYYDKLINKAFVVGLDFDDYVFLKSLLYDAEHNMTFEQNKVEVINKIRQLINKIYESGILHAFTKEQVSYICKNSFLLPLVLANNNGKKISFYKENSYAFYCQFHESNGTSLGVTDYKNLMYCFDCHQGFNNISYIEKIEHLNYKETLQLFCKIFYFTNKETNSYINDIAKKYQDVILSDEYIELLNKGYERLITRGITHLEHQSVEDIYNKRYETIDRIRNHEYDPVYKSLPKQEPKVLKLRRNYE